MTTYTYEGVHQRWLWSAGGQYLQSFTALRYYGYWVQLDGYCDGSLRDKQNSNTIIPIIENFCFCSIGLYNFCWFKWVTTRGGQTATKLTVGGEFSVYGHIRPTRHRARRTGTTGQPNREDIVLGTCIWEIALWSVTLDGVIREGSQFSHCRLMCLSSCQWSIILDSRRRLRCSLRRATIDWQWTLSPSVGIWQFGIRRFPLESRTYHNLRKEFPFWACRGTAAEASFGPECQFRMHSVIPPTER